MSWNNAPLLNKLTATQLGGKRGAQLWGVDFKGTLYTTYQLSPGGGWSDWRGPGWNTKKQPEQIYELAAAQLHDFRAQLWVLDMKRQIWTITQKEAGGQWNDWEGPGWNNLPKDLGLKKIMATQLGGNRGTQLWAITDNGTLTSCYYSISDKFWTPWQDFVKHPDGLPWIEVTACKQGEPRGAIWGIDSNMQLWGMGQKTNDNRVPTDWTAWSGPNWLKFPKVRNIAAVEMAGSYGASIWAITEDYKVIYTFQTARSLEDSWIRPWMQADSANTLRGYEITGAAQNNGCARVWVISLGQVLTTQAMARTGRREWERHWSPEV